MSNSNKSLTFKGSVFHKAALMYAERFKLNVFPCCPREKRPLTRHGCKDATQISTLIDQWWSRHPSANVGIACGPASGNLMVVDIDGKEGMDSLSDFESIHSPFPLTPIVRTGNGVHFYFKTNALVKNYVRVAPGMDIRSNGGYVIAPPSIHPNGRIYKWVVKARIDAVAIADTPDWLIQTLHSKELQSSTSNWLEIVSNTAPKGLRNATLTKLAGHLFRRFVDPDITYRLLWAWNLTCTEKPLPLTEFDRTLNSIAGREFARRERRKA